MSPDDALKLGSLIGAAVLVLAGLWRTVKNSITIRDNVTALRQDMQDLTASRDHLRGEVSTLQQQLEEKTRASYERDARIDSLTQQVREITNTARLVENTNNNLQGRLAEQRDILGTQLTQQSAQIALLNLDVANRDKRIAELEQSQKDKEAALTQANETMTRVQTQLADEQQAREKLERRVSALESQVRDMTAERDQLIKERDDALALVAQRDAQIARLKQELADACAKLAESAPPKAPDGPPPTGTSEAPEGTVAA